MFMYHIYIFLWKPQMTGSKFNSIIILLFRQTLAGKIICYKQDGIVQ